MTEQPTEAAAAHRRPRNGPAFLVRMPSDLHERLMQYAAANDYHAAQVARLAIRRFLSSPTAIRPRAMTESEAGVGRISLTISWSTAGHADQDDALAAELTNHALMFLDGYDPITELAQHIDGAPSSTGAD